MERLILGEQAIELVMIGALLHLSFCSVISRHKLLYADGIEIVFVYVPTLLNLAHYMSDLLYASRLPLV